MQEIMKKFRSLFIKEGILKSLLYAALIAFSALAVSGLVFWMIGFEQVWICAVIFGGVLVVAAPVIYLAAFRPTEKSVARRVDKELGLDERMVTMLELRGNNEVMACAQRANAVSALKSMSGKKISLALWSTTLIAGLSVAVCLGAGTTTVSALAAGGVIPSGAELMSGPDVPPAVYTITYNVQGTGQIMGESVQQVTAGTSADGVYAVAGTDEEGEWIFVGWSDGSTNPYRAEADVSADMTLTAIFSLMDEDGFDYDTDSSDDIPAPIGEGDGTGGDGDSEGPPSPNDEGGDGDSNDNEGQGGRSNPTNQVRDGDIYYGDVIDDSHEVAAGEAEDGDYPEDLVDISEDYFGSLIH